MSGTNQKEIIKRVTSLVFIIASIWWGLYLTSPPGPKPVAAPATEFSAERAFDHVRQIAEKPHMVGTAEHDSVQQYILGELKRLGLNPKIEKGMALLRNRQSTRAVHTQNIIARVTGSNPKRTILLMAHYDTVPYAPGAADDASGVASILEVIRAVQSGESLKNDLIILFTDGEELGLMGARQFAKTNSAIKEVDLILNFEARGTSGSSIMFETNSGNAKLIPQFARFTPDPVANSLTYSIYKILPNDTDFSVFKPYEKQGLNFAFIEEYLNYHTMQDNPGNLSMASLQHQGENLLGNIHGFGNKNFDLSSDKDVIYFNNPFGGITYYPESWAPYLAGLTIFLFLTAIFIGFSRRWLSAKKILIALAGYLGLLLISVLVTWFGWQFTWEFIFPEYRWLQHGENYARSWYLGFFISVATLITLPILTWIKNELNIYNLLAGIYLVLSILLITLTVLLPATNYILLWPVLFGLIGWLLAGKDLEATIWDWKTLTTIAISLFMPLFMYPFYINLMQVALSTRLLAGSIFLVVLLIGILFPLIDYIMKDINKIGGGILVIAIIFFFIGVVLNSDYSSNQKKQNSLIYAANLDNNTSYWLSLDHTTDQWTSQFLGQDPADTTLSEFIPIRRDPLLYSTAPNIDINSPRIKLVKDQIDDLSRSISMEFQHRFPTNVTSIGFPDTSRIHQIQLEEKILYDRAQPITGQETSISHITYYGYKDSTFTIKLIVDPGTTDLEIETTSYNLALPDTLMADYPERSPHTMPKPFGFTNGTIWHKTVNLEEL